MNKIMGAFLGIIGIAIAGILAITFLPSLNLGPLSEAADKARAVIANEAIDALDVKDRVEDALVEGADAIADATGITREEAREVVERLDVTSWEVVALPKDAIALGTVDGSRLGIEGSVTLYADPSYVTLHAYGQDLTLEVPSSARDSLTLLESLS